MAMKHLAVFAPALLLFPLWATEERGGIIPAGTTVSVRVMEEISSKTASPGKTYDAIVDEDIRDSNGLVTIRKGAEAQLVVREAKSSKIRNASLALDLESVMIDGRRHNLAAADVVHEQDKGIGKNRRTAEMVGGGAAIGAVVGAIAGGKTGAAAGAALGAAAGGTTQVLLKGKDVRVPAESVLGFRLEQDMTLRR
jgi:hypothetical protein